MTKNLASLVREALLTMILSRVLRLFQRLKATNQLQPNLKGPIAIGDCSKMPNYVKSGASRGSGKK